MPKMKTNRAAAKRFKRRGSGFKHRKAFRSHILTKKTTKRLREMRGLHTVDKSNAPSVAALCPYI